MKIKFGLATLFVMLMLAFSNSGFLYAQEAGDRDDSPQEGEGVSFIPNDNELASLLTTTPNPLAVVGPLLQTKLSQGAQYNSYRSDGGDSNEQQRNAIARLIYHIGVLLHFPEDKMA